MAALLVSACAMPSTDAAPWEQRLSGSMIALLGEVHDHADGHRLRLATLQRALARGWRPVLVMEQFDTDRQPQIEQARREQPRDVAHLIDRAGGPGWDWPLYRPLLQLALDHDLALVAANLPTPQARRLVREDAAAVLGADRARRLALDRALPEAWQAAQRREIESGHCGALPAAILPGMVRAQAARDAVFAELLARHRSNGAVLIAGNGHVRRDIGVPRWLIDAGVAAGEILAVGYLEAPEDGARDAFDRVVAIAPKLDREDPCLQFRGPREQPPMPAAGG